MQKKKLWLVKADVSKYFMAKVSYFLTGNPYG